jgi:hypothetical protein
MRPWKRRRLRFRLAGHAGGGPRAVSLCKLKALLEEHLDELAGLITIENGKTLGESKGELRRAIENVEVACGMPVLMQGYSLEDVAPGIDEIMVRQPLGVWRRLRRSIFRSWFRCGFCRMRLPREIRWC